MSRHQRPRFTREQHLEAAELAHQAQAALDALGRRVRTVAGLAGRTRVIRAQRVVQMRVIQPLRDDWEAQGLPLSEDPYPRAFYAV